MGVEFSVGWRECFRTGQVWGLCTHWELASSAGHFFGLSWALSFSTEWQRGSPKPARRTTNRNAISLGLRSYQYPCREELLGVSSSGVGSTQDSSHKARPWERPLVMCQFCSHSWCNLIGLCGLGCQSILWHTWVVGKLKKESGGADGICLPWPHSHFVSP